MRGRIRRWRRFPANVRWNARTCLVNAELGRFFVAKVLVFISAQRKYALLYQAGLEGGLFQLQGHNEFAC